MVREEGHYTIKRVDELPKRGNANFLYVLRGATTVDTFYRWQPNGTYETITVGQTGGGGSDDQTAGEVPFTPAAGISATDVQSAIEEVQGNITGGGTDDQTAAEVPLDGMAAGLLSTDVQAGFAEVVGLIPAAVTASQGVTRIGDDLQLGGTLTADALIELDAFTLSLGDDRGNGYLSISEAIGNWVSTDQINLSPTNDLTVNTLDFTWPNASNAGIDAASPKSLVTKEWVQANGSDDQTAAEVSLDGMAAGLLSTDVQAGFAEVVGLIPSAVTVGQGLTDNAGTIELGGTLNRNTTIDTGDPDDVLFNFSIINLNGEFARFSDSVIFDDFGNPTTSAFFQWSPAAIRMRHDNSILPVVGQVWTAQDNTGRGEWVTPATPEIANFSSALVVTGILSGFTNLATILDAITPTTDDPFYLAEVDGDPYLIYDQDNDLYTLDVSSRNKLVFINEQGVRVDDALSNEEAGFSTSRYRVFPIDFQNIAIGPDFVVGNTYQFNYFQTESSIARALISPNVNVVQAPFATTGLIDAASGDVLITKDWFNANAAGGGIGGSIGDNQIAFGDALGNIEGIAGLEYNGTSFLAPGLRVDPTFANFDGRIAVGGNPSFGGTRLGDSDLQTPTLDIGTAVNFVLDDGTQTVQWAAFSNSVGNTLTWRHAQNPTALFSIANSGTGITNGVDDVESTLGLVTEYDTGDPHVYDLFNQNYPGAGSALAEAQGVNMIAPVGDHRKYGIYRAETGLTNITTMFEIDGVDLANQIATFFIPTVVPDDAYGASWDGNFEVPTKNAVYDQIESLAGGGADNLGNHTATQDLNMAGFDIVDATQIGLDNGASVKWRIEVGAGDELKFLVEDSVGSGTYVERASITDFTLAGDDDLLTRGNGNILYPRLGFGVTNTYTSTQDFQSAITVADNDFTRAIKISGNQRSLEANTIDIGYVADDTLSIFKTNTITGRADLDISALTGPQNYAFPNNSGTIALLSDIPAGGGGDLLSTNNLSDVANAATALGNLDGVSLSTTQTITGSKTFSTTARFQGFILADGGFELDATNAALNVFSVYANSQVPTGTANGGAAGQFLMNANDNWTFLSSSSGSPGFTLNNDNLTTLRTFDLPNADGTLALTSDIPSTTDFVTLAGSQTITGTKTFTGIINTFDNLLTVTSHIALTATGGFAQSGKILFAPITTPTGTATGISESQIFAGTNGEMVWLGSGNPAAIFDNTSITTARTYTLPDASGTVALDSTVVDLTSDQTVAGDKVFSGVVSNASATLTSTANSIAWTGQESNLLKITLGENSTLQNPSSPVTDAVYQFIITQDATGGRTLAFGSNFLFSGGTAPDFSGAAANSKHLLTGIYDGTDILITAIQDF